MACRLILFGFLFALAAGCGGTSSTENDVKPLVGKRIPEGAGPDKDKK